MNVRDFACRSYEHAMRLIDGEDIRTVCNNTVIRNTGSTINVELHGAIIVMHYKNGRIVLDSCGYRTNTTKDRINRCLPGRWAVYQTKGEWYLSDLGADFCTPFVDGLTVPGTEQGSKQ